MKRVEGESTLCVIVSALIMFPRIYHMGNRTYLFDVDFWHLKKGKPEDKWEVQYCVDAFHVGNVGQAYCFSWAFADVMPSVVYKISSKSFST